MRSININPVKEYVDRLSAAQAIVFVLSGMELRLSGHLKGFFDRVFLPGVTFKLKDGEVQPGTHQHQEIAAVTTYGGSRLRAFLAGDPPRKLMTRPVRYVTGGAPMHLPRALRYESRER
jgi:NAD(P)H dehydrogenase (quinone)